MSRISIPVRDLASPPAQESDSAVSAHDNEPFKYLDAPAGERSLIALRGLDIGKTSHGYKLGLKVPELSATDYPFLIERWARKFPCEALHQIEALVPLDLPSIGELDDRVRNSSVAHPKRDEIEGFNHDLFYRELRSFRLSEGVELDHYRVFRFQMGREMRHVVFMSVDCEHDKYSSVHDWRYRMQDRHQVSIRLEFERDSAANLSRIVADAKEGGSFLVLDDPASLVNRVANRPTVSAAATIAQSGPQTPALEDHRKLPVICIDDWRAKHREDAHLGVARGGLLYVDSYYPLASVDNQGFRQGELIVALAIGRAVLPNGETGHPQLRRALVKPSQVFDFRTFQHWVGSESSGDTLQSAEALVQSGMAMHRRRSELGIQTEITKLNMGSMIIGELNTNAYHHFAAAMAARGYPVMAKSACHLTPELVKALSPYLAENEVRFGVLHGTVGKLLMRLEEAGRRDLMDATLDVMGVPAPYFVLREGAVPLHCTARAKSSGCDGQLNQEQWWRMVNHERPISEGSLQIECDRLNAVHLFNHQKCLAALRDPAVADLMKHEGEVVTTVVRSVSPFEVEAPSLGVRGSLHRTNVREWRNLEVGDTLRLRFMGLHVPSGRMAFMKVEQELQ